jgi:hypothetical protein
MSEDSPTKQGDLCHLYIDEAGTPDIFDAKGRVNIGKSGCSRFFFSACSRWQIPRLSPRR